MLEILKVIAKPRREMIQRERERERSLLSLGDGTGWGKANGGRGACVPLYKEGV